jgi:hypothetical protein
MRDSCIRVSEWSHQWRRSQALTDEKASSIGLKVGLYGGKNSSLHTIQTYISINDVETKQEGRTVLFLNEPSNLLCMMDIAVVENEDTPRARVWSGVWHLDNISVVL